MTAYHWHAPLAAACMALALLSAGTRADAAGPVPREAVTAGRETQLPVPRFVSLGTAPANVRNGPGEAYNVLWQYKVTGVPFEIIAELDQWRQIRDSDGEQGWIHERVLSGARQALVLGTSEGNTILRAKPEPDATVVAEAQPMALAEIKQCKGDWCRLRAQNRESREVYVGWAPRAELYGTYVGEDFD